MGDSMPPLIADRLVKQMNANGDERIDHDEFVKFYAKLFMGTLEQKMLIAFRCYDVDDDQNISETEVKLVLRNIPRQNQGRYGESFYMESTHLTRVQKMDAKLTDS